MLAPVAARFAGSRRNALRVDLSRGPICTRFSIRKVSVPVRSPILSSTRPTERGYTDVTTRVFETRCRRFMVMFAAVLSCARTARICQIGLMRVHSQIRARSRDRRCSKQTSPGVHPRGLSIDVSITDLKDARRRPACPSDSWQRFRVGFIRAEATGQTPFCRTHAGIRPGGRTPCCRTARSTYRLARRIRCLHVRIPLRQAPDLQGSIFVEAIQRVPHRAAHSLQVHRFTLRRDFE